MNKEKEQLLKSDEFEDALNAGAELKKNLLTSYKSEHKMNYERFYETMLMSRQDITDILDKKSKNRTDDDKEKVKQFKKDVSRMYKQTCEFLTPETVEEGRQTKLQKLISKFAGVVELLRYIESPVLDSELNKVGLSFTTKTNLSDNPSLEADSVKDNVKDIFDCAVKIKQKVQKDSDEIVGKVFTNVLPVDLQFDKDVNNDGLKPADFSKLVDMKAKLMMAKSPDEKQKIDEKIEQIASDKQFDIARAELMQTALTDLQ